METFNRLNNLTMKQCKYPDRRYNFVGKGVIHQKNTIFPYFLAIPLKYWI